MIHLNTKRIEEGLLFVENEFSSIDEIQSLDMLIKKLDILCSIISWSNSQMAIAKKEFNQAKTRAYNTYIGSSLANSISFSPLILKDYIASKLSNEQYAYDIAERLSRTCVHIIDALRTAISALKGEREVSNYSQSIPNY